MALAGFNSTGKRIIQILVLRGKRGRFESAKRPAQRMPHCRRCYDTGTRCDYLLWRAGFTMFDSLCPCRYPKSR